SCAPPGRGLDRGANALIGAAAADVALHRAVDVGIARIRRARQERSRLHDLTGLAVAALRDVVLCPGGLHWVRAVRAEPLDGHDLLVVERLQGRLAGADGRAIQVHSASTAQSGAATEPGPGEAQVVTEIPKQRHVLVAVEHAGSAIYSQIDHVSGFLVGPELCHGL